MFFKKPVVNCEIYVMSICFTNLVRKAMRVFDLSLPILQPIGRLRSRSIARGVC